MNETMSLSSSWDGGPQVLDHDNADDENRVMHDYHDHSMDMMDDPYALEQVMSSQRRSSSDDDDDNTVITVQHQNSDAFPVKLHIMLSQAEIDGNDNICSWQPHGRCFVVHNVPQFQKTIMPRYFKAHRYSSFQRQLNLYGFKRITAGPDKGGYYHELFLKHRLFLTHRIHRFTRKGTKCRTPASPETEPNFYKMAFMTAIDEAAKRAALFVGNQGSSSTQKNNILELVAARPTSSSLYRAAAYCLPTTTTVPSPDVMQSAHISGAALTNTGAPADVDLIGQDGSSGPDFAGQVFATPSTDGSATGLFPPSQISGTSLDEDLQRQPVSVASTCLIEAQPTTRSPSSLQGPSVTCGAIAEQLQTQQSTALAASSPEAMLVGTTVEATTTAASVISSLPAHLQLTYVKTMLAMETARKNGGIKSANTPSTSHNDSSIAALPVIPITTRSSTIVPHQSNPVTTTTTRTATSTNNNNNALSLSHCNLTAPPRLYYQVVNQPNATTSTFQSPLLHDYSNKCADEGEDDDDDEKEFDIILSTLRNMPVTVEQDDLSLVDNRYMGSLLERISK